MKQDNETTGLPIGKIDATTQEICRCPTKKSVTPDPDDKPRQWSGRPGEDLFFNGWKLLF